VWYAQRSVATDGDGDGDGDGGETATLQLRPATVRGVHLEHGAERPYYTVALHDDTAADGGDTQRELQTEWWRYVFFCF
jgi:hypothetical protein